MRLTLLTLLLAVSMLFPLTAPYRLERVVARASDSVVRLTIQTPQGDGTCSGEVLAPNRILTAKHCTEGTIQVDGKPATVLATDAHYDLALLEAETARPALVLRDAPVSRFERVVGIGYAFGLTKLTVLPVAVTIVNVIPFEDAAPGIILQGSFIGGMSGGPVIDYAGYMVSIVQEGAQGVAHGVPVTLIRAFLLSTDVEL